MALLSDLVIPFSVFKELAASRVSDRDQLNSHSYDAAAIGNFLSLIIIVKKRLYFNRKLMSKIKIQNLC